MRPRAATAEDRLDQLLALHDLLGRVSRELGPALELDPVLRTVLSAMRSLIDFRGGTIGLVDERGVYVAASDPPVSADVAAARVPVGEGLAGRCVAHGETVYSPDLDRDPRVDPELRRIGTNRAMRSYLAVPLVCLGDTIGVLQVDSEDLDAFDADDFRVLKGLSTQVAGAIESARRFEAMRRLDDARSMFIARVSHELRTPVTILKGFVELLLSRPSELGIDHEAKDIVVRIDAACGRLERLVEELLMVAALETGDAPTSGVSHVDVARLLHSVREQAVDPSLVSVECPFDLGARADEVLLRHLLALLVQNAVSFAGSVELVAGASGDSTRVDVVDHGPGIPDELKGLVFERFWRGGHPGSGWGLGLSLVDRLAGAMGATLTLSDTDGGGATFTVTLDGGGGRESNPPDGDHPSHPL